MFAVIKTGGKQYSVESGTTLKVEKIDGKKGDGYTFKNVLIIGDNKNQILGNPEIKGASVDATIMYQIRDKKVTVFKKKRRQNYRRTKGHRQYLTIVKIDKINSKPGEVKKVEKKEKTAKKIEIEKKDLNKKVTSSSSKTKKKVIKKTKKNIGKKK